MDVDPSADPPEPHGERDLSAATRESHGEHGSEPFDARILVDVDGKVYDADQRALAAIGVDRADLVSTNLVDEFVDVGDRAHLRSALADAANGCQRRVEIRWRPSDNGNLSRHLEVAVHRHREPGCRAALVRLTVRDAGQRDHLEAQLRLHMFYDSLTKLPRRELFEEQLARLMRCDSDEQPGSRLEPRGVRAVDLAVVVFDLDGFAQFNNCCGRAAGDAILRKVASRLRRMLAIDDRVARLGGDEFAFAATVDDIGGVGHIAEQLVTEISAPFDLAGGSVVLGASCGVTTLGGRVVSPDVLLQEADAAMRHAKAHDPGRWSIYDPVQQRRAAEAVRTKAELTAAIDEDQIRVHYQPIVIAGTGRLVAFEALARWQHRTRGLLGAPEFIPLAERTNLISALGAQLMRRAALDLALLNHGRTIAGHVAMGINMSPSQIVADGFLDEFAAACSAAEIAPSRLVVEITETGLLRDPRRASDVVRQLRQWGVRVALDDFGCGYSSLSHLLDFDIDIVKIDRSFVGGLADDRQSRAIVRAIVEMARAMDLAVVAEGVETEMQRQFLVDTGCDLLQGYLFGRPAPIDAIDLGVIDRQA